MDKKRHIAALLCAIWTVLAFAGCQSRVPASPTDSSGSASVSSSAPESSLTQRETQPASSMEESAEPSGDESREEALGFDAVELGMSLAQVNLIMGRQGVESSLVPVDGVDAQSYEWTIDGDIYMVAFVHDAVVAMATVNAGGGPM